MSYNRPGFWRMPRQESLFEYPAVFPTKVNRRRVHFEDEVQMGSPAQGELLRGDVLTKIEDYDSRDLRHEDAQTLFRNAGNRIRLVIQRNYKAGGQALSNGSSRCSSTIPNMSPINQALSPPNPQLNVPYRTTSPAVARVQTPLQALPQTTFPSLNESGGYEAPSRPESSLSCFSPQPTRDYQSEAEEDTTAILNQPYRTTPLILPGAKVKRDTGPTECYLRHHPNPAMRANPHQENFHDILMKQKVADSVLHRVVGDDPNKVIKKQFNSPIGLYSDSNIERAIHQTVPPENGNSSILDRPMPSKIEGYKKTVVFDPLKSETYRAIQEQSAGYNPKREEVSHSAQTRVFQPNRMVPSKKPTHPSSYPPPNPHINVSQAGDEDIHQSGSFKRLMYSVMGETDY